MELAKGDMVFVESDVLDKEVLEAYIMAVKPVELLDVTVKPTVLRKKVPLLLGVVLAQVFGVTTSTVNAS